MARKTRADLRHEPVDDTAVDERFVKKTQGAVLGSTREEADLSWAVVGIDTSLTAVSACAIGFDAKLDRMMVEHGEMRWQPETGYYERLGQAARSHDLMLDLLRKLWVIHPHRVFVAVEEPFHMGAVQRQVGSWVKQQAEVGGAVKGALVRYGFPNIVEVGNTSWKKVLRERWQLKSEKVPRGATASRKKSIALANKMAVKTWAMESLGLPDIPDLVASKSGAKIPRPESGFGARAQAVQPSDIYDAAGVCVWMLNELDAQGVITWPL